MKSISLWIKDNRSEFILITIVLVLAIFFRFYRIEDYMTFLGDEGRDAIVVKKILVEHHLPLLGPPTSIGNIYDGPLYYYMMAAAMAIFWLNPVGAAVMVALVGVLTVGLIYYLTREWFGVTAAGIASLLYALSPVTIFYSRSSWNPNPLPFFTLLGILSLYLLTKTRKNYWLILTGISLAFAIQMHFLALILIPIFSLIWLVYFIKLLKQKKSTRGFILNTVVGVLIFCILMSPLVIFDFKYNFSNFQNFKAYFANRETTVNLNALNASSRIPDIYSAKLIGRYMAVTDYPLLNNILSIMILLVLVVVIYRLFKQKKNNWAYVILVTWFMVGIIGISLNKLHIYDHYLNIINPTPFILLAAAPSLLRNKKMQVIVGILLILVLSKLELDKSPILQGSNNQLKRTQKIAQFVISQAAQKPFNFALIAEHNYDAAYQYYLDLYGHKPNVLPFEKTGQLFVVCEDKVCKPLGHPKYEIAAFGWALINGEQDFEGVKVFKLVHNPQQEQYENSKLH